MPKLSIVTVVYNGEAGIEETILSVINQTFSDIEFIVIDGGSTDHTIELIGRYTSKINLVISEPDKGIYDAMNKGILNAHGEWILFMNAGDKFHNETVVEQVFNREAKFADAAIAYGDVNYCYATHETLQSQQWRNIRYNSICHQTQFIRRSLLLEQSGYDTKYKIYADFDFQLKMNEIQKRKLVHVPVCIVDYNMMGVSSGLFYHFLGEYLNIVNKVPVSKRLGYYIYALSFAGKSLIVDVLSRIGLRKNG